MLKNSPLPFNRSWQQQCKLYDVSLQACQLTTLCFYRAILKFECVQRPRSVKHNISQSKRKENTVLLHKSKKTPRTSLFLSFRFFWSDFKFNRGLWHGWHTWQPACEEHHILHSWDCMYVCIACIFACLSEVRYVWYVCPSVHTSNGWLVKGDLSSLGCIVASLKDSYAARMGWRLPLCENLRGANCQKMFLIIATRIHLQTLISWKGSKISPRKGQRWTHSCECSRPPKKRYFYIK